MRENRIIFACLGLAVTILIAAWFIGLSAFIQSAASLSPPTQLRKLDAIVVLTGGSNRVDAGFDLLGKGYGKKLFISGVYRGLDVRKLLKRWKDEPQSSLDCCVVLGFEADNTAGNAVETVEWLRRENFHSLYLVTANYHIKRALMEFRRIAPDLEIVPFPVAPDRLDMKSWWQDSAMRILIVREYMKYITMYFLHNFLR
jgi:uncharacterized SAM-binding protein YcdF (DUF218 family)